MGRSEEGGLRYLGGGPEPTWKITDNGYGKKDEWMTKALTR
jgi:hypothetical protein